MERVSVRGEQGLAGRKDIKTGQKLLALLWMYDPFLPYGLIDTEFRMHADGYACTEVLVALPRFI